MTTTGNTVKLGADGSTLEFLTLQGKTRVSPKQDNGLLVDNIKKRSKIINRMQK